MLAQVVVQFAGDAAALFILNVEQAGGQFLKFEGAQFDDPAGFVELGNAFAKFLVQGLDALLGFAAFGHVLGNFGETGQRAIGRAQRGNNHGGPESCAVLADAPAFVGEAAFLQS